MVQFSHDLVKISANRVLVATLTPPDRTVSMAREEFSQRFLLPPASDRANLVGLPFGPARNQALKTALEQGYGWLFFLDADSVPRDPGIVMALMARNLPVVSGLYYQRFHPYQPCFFNQAADAQGNPIKTPVLGWTPGDLVPALFVPTGALLIKRSVVEEVLRRFDRPFVFGSDIAAVPDRQEGTVQPFSEDFVFSWRLKNYLGIDSYVDTSQVVMHEARAVVGPKWVLPTPDPNPLFGVCAII